MKPAQGTPKKKLQCEPNDVLKDDLFDLDIEKCDFHVPEKTLPARPRKAKSKDRPKST